MEQDVLGCFSPLSVVWFISVFSLPARGLEEGALPCAHSDWQWLLLEIPEGMQRHEGPRLPQHQRRACGCL